MNNNIPTSFKLFRFSVVLPTSSTRSNHIEINKLQLQISMQNSTNSNIYYSYPMKGNACPIVEQIKINVFEDSLCSRLCIIAGATLCDMLR